MMAEVMEIKTYIHESRGQIHADPLAAYYLGCLYLDTLTGFSEHTSNLSEISSVWKPGIEM